MRRRGRRIDGWVVLDKPTGMTSTRAVSEVRRLFNAQKAGHAGTLDPLASGLLPIALGEATKTVSFVMGGRKTYRFTIRWGAETSTDDGEGEVVETSKARPTPDEITTALGDFTGTIDQVPPAFSAIKVDGERAYDLARDGEAVALAPRPVTIHRLSLVGAPDADTATLEAECGKGTYIRALARDLGRQLACLGHVESLRRTAVGPFGEGDMIPLEMLKTFSHSARRRGELIAALRPVETALDDIPALAVDRSDAARLRKGQAIFVRGRDAIPSQGTVFVRSRGELVALAEIERGEVHPKRIFNLAAPDTGPAPSARTTDVDHT